MSDKSLIVFGDESKLVKGKIGFYDENGWPVLVADINQHKDVVSNPLDIAYKMAAAPDMLEALESMVNMMDCGDEYGEGGQWHKTACEAIAKAKGESK